MVTVDEISDAVEDDARSEEDDIELPEPPPEEDLNFDEDEND